MRICSIITASTPVESNTAGPQRVGFFHPRAFDPTQHVEFPVRQNFAETQRIHPASSHETQVVIGPDPRLKTCQPRAIGHHRRGGIHTYPIFTDGSQGRACMRQQAQRVMAHGRSWTEQNDRDTLQWSRVVAGTKRIGLCCRTLKERKGPVSRGQRAASEVKTPCSVRMRHLCTVQPQTPLEHGFTPVVAAAAEAACHIHNCDAVRHRERVAWRNLADHLPEGCHE